METFQLPSILVVPSLSTADRAAILDHLFEPCTSLHTLSVSLLKETSFKSYDDLVSSVGLQLTELAESASTSDAKWLESILAAHPRLGQRSVDSTQSSAEQAQLRSIGDEAEALAKLNAEYEQTFPGLRYVVFVNGRSRDVIMEDMRSRIKRNDPRAERTTAIKVTILNHLFLWRY
ncbi:MAG: hypothetical protein Q9167_007653 [Letrouitia subvulpina]